MRIFIAIDGERKGPFTLFQVEERLRAGELKEDQLAWYEGMAEWRPLQDLDPFESFFRLRDADLEDERRKRVVEKTAVYERKREAALTDTEVRPWTRFWARNLDFFFFLTACLLVFSALRAMGWIEAGTARFIDVFPIFLPLWHLVEAYLISQWGTTGGKALVGIRITDAENGKLSLGNSLRRSLGVYVLGVGLYIGGLQIIAGVCGYYFLHKNRRTFWDATAESSVHHAPFQARHVLLPLAIVFLLLALFQSPFSELADYQAAEMEALRKAFRGEAGQTL